MVCSMVLGPWRHQENEKGTSPTFDPIEKGKEAHKKEKTSQSGDQRSENLTILRKNTYSFAGGSLV